MRLQSSQALCGAAALANALRAVGVHKATEDRIVTLIKASADASDGTPAAEGIGPVQLDRAAGAFGYVLEPVTVHNPLAAFAMLRGWVAGGYPVLLAVDWHNGDAGHWMAAVGVMGDYVLVADSANDEIVLPYAGQALCRRWKSDTDPASLYSLVLKRTYAPRKKKTV